MNTAAGEQTPNPGAAARHLVRATSVAALATALDADAWPYASLVMSACGHDGAPILLLSALAEHSRNMARDNRVSLLYDGTDGAAERLSGSRVTVLGHARKSEAPELRERFLARHPDAHAYAGFRDFAIYRIEVTRAHLVAGFGRIDWIEPADLLFDASGAADLAAPEADIVAHMNGDHADVLDLCATRLLGRHGEGWRMTGCDPEGCDLRRGGEVARLGFAAPVADANGARQELVRLAQLARMAQE